MQYVSCASKKRVIFATWAAAALSLMTLTITTSDAQPNREHPSTPGGMSVLTEAATVVSSVHYQLEVQLSCSFSTCNGVFPSPGAGRRLKVARIACLMQGGMGSTFSRGIAAVQRGDQSLVVRQFLAIDHSASDGWHTLSSAVDLQVAAHQHIHVFLGLVSGTAFQARCTGTGTLDVLQ